MADFLSLEWSEKIVGVEASVQDDRVQVRRCFVLDREDAPQEQGPLSEWLRAALDEQGVTARQAVVSLPRQDVVTRNLELPVVSSDELPDLVRFQAGAKSSLPLDQMGIDFLPLPHDEDSEACSVLLATVPKATIDEITTVLAGAGIGLVGLGVGSVALTDLVVMDASSVGDGLVVAGDATRLDVTIHRDGRTAFTHSTWLAEDGDSIQAASQAISRALFAARNSMPDLKVGDAHLLGPLSNDLVETVRARLSGPGFDTRVEVISLKNLSRVRFEEDPGDTAELPAVGAVLGQLLGHAGLVAERIDFLDPHRAAPPARRISGQNLAYALAAVCVMAVLITGIRTWRTSDVDGLITGVKKKVAKEERAFFGGTPVTKKLPSVGLVDRWKSQRVNWLDQFSELSPLIDNDEIVFTELDMTQEVRTGLGRITVTGLATDRRPVTDLTNRVRGSSNYKVPAKKFDENKDRDTQDYKIRFSKVDISLEGKAKPPKAAPKSDGDEEQEGSTTASTERTGS